MNLLNIFNFGILRILENGNFIFELHYLHLVVFVGLLNVLSRLRKLLRCPFIVWWSSSVFVLVLLLCQNLLKKDFDFLLVLRVFFLQLVLQKLLLDEC